MLCGSAGMRLHAPQTRLHLLPDCRLAIQAALHDGDVQGEGRAVHAAELQSQRLLSLRLHRAEGALHAACASFLQVHILTTEQVCCLLCRLPQVPLWTMHGVQELDDECRHVQRPGMPGADSFETLSGRLQWNEGCEAVGTTFQAAEVSVKLVAVGRGLLRDGGGHLGRQLGGRHVQGRALPEAGGGARLTDGVTSLPNLLQDSAVHSFTPAGQ